MCMFFIIVESAKEPNKKLGVDYIIRGFDYDFLFVFFSGIKDWISSQKQSKYASTKKSSSIKNIRRFFLRMKIFLLLWRCKGLDKTSENLNWI